jgi:hypothetical protein
VAFRDVAGEQVEVGERIYLTRDQLIQIRSTAATAFVAAGVPFRDIGEFFQVSPMTIRRWIGGLSDDLRPLLADPSNQWISEALGARVGFDFLPHAVERPCYDSRESEKNTCLAAKSIREAISAIGRQMGSGFFTIKMHQGGD